MKYCIVIGRVNTPPLTKEEIEKNFQSFQKKG